MDMDVDSECEDSKHDSDVDTNNKDKSESPLDTSGLGILNSNLNLTTPVKNTAKGIRRPRSTIKRPRSSIKRLSLASLRSFPAHSSQNSSNNSPTLSIHSNGSNTCTQPRIKRPRLSISRPTRTVNRTNHVKRLSLASVSRNMMETDDLFDGLSTKSMESQQTITSKISFISSPSSSNKSSIIQSTQREPDQRENDQNVVRKMKLANAQIHLEIDKLQIEKNYYENIIESIKTVVMNDNVCNENKDLTEQLKNILNVEA